MASDPRATVTKDTVEARQGTTKPHLVRVLGISLVLVIVAFAIVWVSTKH